MLSVSVRHCFNISCSRVMSLVPGRTTNSLPLAFPLTLQASQRHVCLEWIFWLWRIKTTLVMENCTILKKCSDVTNNNQLSKYCFVVMQCILVHEGTARTSV